MKSVSYDFEIKQNREDARQLRQISEGIANRANTGQGGISYQCHQDCERGEIAAGRQLPI